MAITDKSRKLLWARSGNRCALCRSELIMDRTPGSVGNESVIGDECHIISLRLGGPRYDPTLPTGNGDEYSNLILLCKVHHKVVDDQHTDYPAERLKELKLQHERWVSKSLASENAEPKPVRIRSVNSPDYLIRITKGSELLAIVDGICASSFTHDELVSEGEVALIGGFLETVQDWGDLAPIRKASGPPTRLRHGAVAARATCPGRGRL